MFALQVEKAANIIDYVFNQGGGGGGGDIYSGTSRACSCCEMVEAVEEKACSCLGTCCGSS